MTSITPLLRTGAVAMVLALSACQKAPAPPAAAPAPATDAPAPVAPPVADAPAAPPAAANGAWPASLTVFGEGFPNPGDPCRNVGESAATVDFLDHTAWLVGCQSEDDAVKLGGKVVARIDGVTLISVPR